MVSVAAKDLSAKKSLRNVETEIYVVFSIKSSVFPEQVKATEVGSKMACEFVLKMKVHHRIEVSL